MQHLVEYLHGCYKDLSGTGYSITEEGERVQIATGYGPVITIDTHPNKICIAMYPKPNVIEVLTATFNSDYPQEFFGHVSSNRDFRSPFPTREGLDPFRFETLFSSHVFWFLLKKSMTKLKQDASKGSETFSFRFTHDICYYLGRGASSTVWRDTKLRALKVFAPDTERFAEEVVILKNNQHANVIKFLGSGNVGGDPAYRMELADISLREYLLYGKLKPNTLEVVCEDIARGLAFLHSRNILHGDLATCNIALFISNPPPRGIVAKIIDFGSAMVVKNLPSEAYYDLTFGSDIWALGCIYHSCCYGEEIDSPEMIPSSKPKKSNHAKIDNIIWDMCFVPKRASAAQIVKIWGREEYAEPLFSEETVEYSQVPLVYEEGLFTKSFV